MPAVAIAPKGSRKTRGFVRKTVRGPAPSVMVLFTTNGIPESVTVKSVLRKDGHNETYRVVGFERVAEGRETLSLAPLGGTRAAIVAIIVIDGNSVQEVWIPG